MDWTGCFERKIKFNSNTSFTGINFIFQIHLNLIKVSKNFQKVFILWPLVISKYISPKNALIVYSKAYPMNLFICLIIFLFVYFTSSFKNPITNDYDYRMYLTCFIISCFSSIIDSTMSVSQAAFFASISRLIFN